MESRSWKPGKSVSPCNSKEDVLQAFGKKFSKTTNIKPAIDKNGDGGKKIGEKAVEPRDDFGLYDDILDLRNDFPNASEDKELKFYRKFCTLEVGAYGDVNSKYSDCEDLLRGVNLVSDTSEVPDNAAGDNVDCKFPEEEQNIVDQNTKEVPKTESLEVPVLSFYDSSKSDCINSLAEFELQKKLAEKKYFPLSQPGYNDTACNSAMPLSELLRSAKSLGLDYKMQLFSLSDHKESWPYKPFKVPLGLSSGKCTVSSRQSNCVYSGNASPSVNALELSNTQRSVHYHRFEQKVVQPVELNDQIYQDQTSLIVPSFAPFVTCAGATARPQQCETMNKDLESMKKVQVKNSHRSSLLQVENFKAVLNPNQPGSPNKFSVTSRCQEAQDLATNVPQKSPPDKICSAKKQNFNKRKLDGKDNCPNFRLLPNEGEEQGSIDRKRRKKSSQNSSVRK